MSQPVYAKPGRINLFLTRLVDRTPAWVGPLAAAGGIGLGVLYMVLVRPTSVYAATHPTCIMRVLTGFDCPGCGGTRAAWFLIHGDLLEAARHHALLVFATPFLAYMYLTWTLRTWFGWKVPQYYPSPRATVGFLVIWGVFSVLRNLPWEPFTSLYV